MSLLAVLLAVPLSLLRPVGALRRQGCDNRAIADASLITESAATI
jgi:hypothetical protein